MNTFPQDHNWNNSCTTLDQSSKKLEAMLDSCIIYKIFNTKNCLTGAADRTIIARHMPGNKNMIKAHIRHKYELSSIS